MEPSPNVTATFPAAPPGPRPKLCPRAAIPSRARIALAGLPVLLLLTGAARTAAQPSSPSTAPDRRVYAIAHVDVTQSHIDEAMRAIRGYVAATRQDAGAERIDAIQEMRPNHFDLIEVWQDPASYRAHQESLATIHFHDQIYPWRGSPFEERLGNQIAP